MRAPLQTGIRQYANQEPDDDTPRNSLNPCGCSAFTFSAQGNFTAQCTTSPALDATDAHARASGSATTRSGPPGMPTPRKFGQCDPQ